MRICLVVNANAQTGYGHYHRCRALAYELVSLGHTVWFVGDVQPRLAGVRYNAAFDSEMALNWLQLVIPHWAVVDLPDETPDWVYSDMWKTCVIDGVGQPNTERADLIISSGVDGSDYCAPKYLMLRPELINVRPSHYRRNWLVFGGGYDVMGLCDRFSKVMPNEPAHLVASSFGKHLVSTAKHSVDYATADAHICSLYGIGEKACVSMGMTVWELLALEVPCYVFSKTERHLESAKKMKEWLHYYPRTGLPKSDKAMVNFLSQPPKTTKAPIDFEGARRVAELF